MQLDMVGRNIGRYEIREKIAEGGMAHVYRAYDPQIDRAVALKILKSEHSVEGEHQDRFLREGKAAGVLNHPNIVTIFDVGSLDGTPYIMMELLEGMTLGDLLRQGQLLPTRVIIKIAMQLADALAYAHDKGVVHRDLKPDNIVLGADGESIKIADFGIARIAEAANQETTQAGMILGTPRYMSPEQATGSPVDGRSDLFTLGVILYEMLTGKKAFEAESIPTLIMQIVEKNPLPIRQVKSDVPAGLQRLVNKLLRKKPEQRFQSGRELYAALEHELLAVQEEDEERARYLPLQIKWTAIMAIVVSLAMAISSVLVFRAQRDALTRQAVDSGISLSHFIAVQAAVPLLAEDWITLESFVHDTSTRETFSYLILADHKGVVRAATDPDLIGGEWDSAELEETLWTSEEAVVARYDAAAAEIFNFSLPVRFGDKKVGAIDVGLDANQLNAALETTRRLMIALLLATVAAVSLAAYIFNKVITRQLSLVTRALGMFGAGLLETRISRERSDEFGDLFKSYNEMAEETERKIEIAQAGGSGAEAGSTASVPAPGHLHEISGITMQNLDDDTIVQSADDSAPKS